jgi:peroxiredoxin
MTKTLSFCGFLLLLAVVSCSSQYKGGKFEITGKVKDSASKMIYLKEVDFTNNNTIPIDSFKIKPDGAYMLKSDVKEQHLFVLMVDQGFPFLVINDGSQINIDITPSDPLHPHISGSEATKNLYVFINKYRLKDSVLAKTFVALDSLQKLPAATPAQDSLISTLGKEKDVQLADMNNLVKNFANTADNAISVFYVLAVMAPRSFPPQDLLQLVQAASNRFKNDGNLAGFASRIKDAIAAQNPGSSFPLLNQTAPDLAMQSPDGKTIKISDFRGKYLLVDFWASWCMPCRAENPNVVAMFNKYKNKNFTILGVSLDRDKDAWTQAIMKDGLTWNHMSDLKQWGSAAVQAYHFNGIPFNVLIDPSGKIIADNLRGSDLDQKLAEVLK